MKKKPRKKREYSYNIQIQIHIKLHELRRLRFKTPKRKLTALPALKPPTRGTHIVTHTDTHTVTHTVTHTDTHEQIRTLALA